MTSRSIAQSENLLGGYAYQIIRQQSKQVFKLRSPVLADTDPEAVHEMRIGTRRLRSALSLFGNVITIQNTDSKKSSSSQLADAAASGIPSRLTKAVSKLTKTLGKVRDLDVMQQWLEKTLAAPNSDKAAATSQLEKAEKKTVKALLKKLKKRRKQKFSSLKKVLSNKSYKKLTHQFNQWLEQPTFLPAAQEPAARAAAVRIVGPITELLQHPGWQVGTSTRSNQTSPIEGLNLSDLNSLLARSGHQLHDLRKQIKGIRYQMEFFRGLFDLTYAAQVREFRAIQSLLGQLQDQTVISQFFTDEIGADWPQQLPTIEAAFQASRLDLWQQWQSYQRKYLKLQSVAISAA